MARENETYRAELEQIRNVFGMKNLLTVTDVANYTGRSRNWVRQKFGISGKDGITAVKLAYELSSL
jgi:hypothetical protein